MKTIIFDFDGTLTTKDQNLWRMLWQQCGYSIDENSPYRKLYVGHVFEKQVTRREWFEKTCEYFQKANCSKDDLIAIANKITLIDGFEETILTLYERGYVLYILSGGIKEIIEIVIKGFEKYFKKIESNSCVFDQDGKLKYLKPADCDFSGKSKYIKALKDKGVSEKDIIFVGNAENDEWVYKEGCKTICINPTSADTNDSKKWNVVLSNVKNLKEVLKYI